MPSTSTRPSARDRILATASELFYREGIRGVGIDRIIAESGVAKMTLYKHFKSKDALIAAWLQEREDAWSTWFQTRVEHLARDPRERLVAVFDALQEWCERPDFRGCPFINSAVEIVDAEHPGQKVCAVHQQATFDYLLSLASAAEMPDPEALAQQLVVLVNGAVVTAMLQGNAEAAGAAKQIAIALIAR